LNSLAEYRAKGKIGFGSLDLLEETGHEEEEAFWSGVVTGAICISPVDEDFSDPSESVWKLVATTVGEEEGEHVHTDDRIKTPPLAIKVCLAKRVT
jgi:hypothetical protein